LWPTQRFSLRVGEAYEKLVGDTVSGIKEYVHDDLTKRTVLGEEPDFEWREMINDHCEHLEIPVSGILLDMKLESAQTLKLMNLYVIDNVHPTPLGAMLVVPLTEPPEPKFPLTNTTRTAA
jgi:hypothetical protein